MIKNDGQRGDSRQMHMDPKPIIAMARILIYMLVGMYVPLSMRGWLIW